LRASTAHATKYFRRGNIKAGPFMSEHSVTIVDIDVSLEDAPATAARMLAWLQAEGIVGEGISAGDIQRDWFKSTQPDWFASGGAETVSELINDPRIVYRPGPHYRKACADSAHLEKLTKNWLEIDIQRQVFHAGENGYDAFCPSCQTQHETWLATVDDWYGGGAGILICEYCGYKAPLNQWRIDPVWAFGNLGFRFCDWLLEPEFVADFIKRLGNNARVVHCHL
jgi:hypothetical protein